MKDIIKDNIGTTKMCENLILYLICPIRRLIRNIFTLLSGIALATYFLRLQIVIKKRGKRSLGRSLEESWQERISHNIEHVISATEKISPKIISSVKS